MNKHFLFIPLIALLLSGCGGDGGGDSTPAATSTTNTTPTPTTPAVVFEPSENFQAACEVPRSGIDPLTGMAYADYPGSIEQENEWLRSWSNELYLWYDEIVYQDPALYNDPLDYFDTLRTLATTPSGSDRDNFHFTYPTEEWIQLSQSGVSSGYGASFSLYEINSEILVLVAYVEPGSTADLAGLARGTSILTINDVSFSEDTDAFYAGLFPETSGETHRFLIQQSGSSSSTEIMITSSNASSSPVLATQTLSTSTGNVGYFLFNDHVATAEYDLATAISYLEGESISDLVLDLRYNGGGYLAIAAQLAYMIAGPARTENRNFESQTFNDKHPTINPVTQELIEPMPFIDETLGFSAAPGQLLPSLDLSRVFILTGHDTCSASEAIINGLRGINVEVILIGSTTCGKPYGFYPQDNCGTTYFTIQFSGENDIGFSDYSDGFSPQNYPFDSGVPVTGCAVADDYTNELGDPLEARLAAALSYRETLSCPSVTTLPISSNVSFSSSNIRPLHNESTLGPNMQSFSRDNRILGLPR